MKIALYPFYKNLLKNKIFDIKDKEMNRDDIMMPFYQIKEELEKKGISFETIDIYEKKEKKDVILYFNRNFKGILQNKESINIYFAWEPEVVDKNHSKEGLKKIESFFDYIMTWNDELIDNKKYFKINYPYFFSKKMILKKTFKQKKLLVNISGNKESNDEKELYSERVKVINYFERNNLKDFDLYGIGWDSSLKTYRGKTESKFETYSNYKFALCLENMKEVKGYITEKIFDCFVSGVVPVYQGALNIGEYIPKNCYIEYEKFKNIEEMEMFLKNISEEEYKVYLKNIENYLDGSQKSLFEASFFIKQLLSLDLTSKTVNPNYFQINLMRLKIILEKIERKFSFFKKR